MNCEYPSNMYNKEFFCIVQTPVKACQWWTLIVLISIRNVSWLAVLDETTNCVSVQLIVKHKLAS